MRCPHCQSGTVWYGQSLLVHYLRMIVNSNKRYCPSCHGKWILRSRRTSPNLTLVALIVLSSAAAGIFFTNMSSSLFSISRDTADERDAYQQYLSLAKSKMQQDPHAMEHMDASKKQKMQELMQQYGGKSSF